MQKDIRRRAKLYGMAAILLAVILASVCFQLGYIPSIKPSQMNAFMSTFSSYDELKQFLQTRTTNRYGYPYYARSGEVFTFGGPQATFGPAITDVQINKAEGTDYSGTNVQVTGVDESDKVKTDGTYLYILSANKVSIIKAYPPTEAQLLSTITFDEMTPTGIFVNKNVLAVLGSNYTMQPQPLYYSTGLPYSSYIGETTTFVLIYDISNRASPELLKTVSTSGGYLSSRMIADYIYIVAGQPAYYRILTQQNVTVELVDLPEIETSGEAKTVPATEVYYSNTTDEYFTFTTILAVNTQDAGENATSKTLMIGGTSTMYVSLSDMYITYATYDSTYQYGQTSIYRIHVDKGTITPAAQGKVPGSILNQFSMDQYGDYFRVATSSWGPVVTTVEPSNQTKTPLTVVGGQQTNVYVLDMNLSIVGRLEGLAQGENFHSARFMGDKCYLVTFINIDPLFVIDLSNPAEPTEMGNLTIPGYSDYLHPYDENHLIGVGKETTESGEKYFAWYQGVKISLFDVTNVTNPLQMFNVTIGDRGTSSPVLYDHRAFLFNKSPNLLAMPIFEYRVNESQWYPDPVPANAYGEPIWQGVYVYNLTVANGFILKGTVTHLESGTNIWNTAYHIERSLYIDNVLYTVSDTKVQLNSLEDLSTIKAISLI